MNDELENRFRYHKPTAEKVVQHEATRAAFREIAEKLAELPATREQALALTHLEESLMWANAAIARH